MRRLVLIFVLSVSSVVSAATSTCSQENLEELFRITYRELVDGVNHNTELAKLVMAYDKKGDANFKEFKAEFIKMTVARIDYLKNTSKTAVSFVKEHPECNIDNFVTTTYKTK